MIDTTGTGIPSMNMQKSVNQVTVIFCDTTGVKRCPEVYVNCGGRYK